MIDPKPLTKKQTKFLALLRSEEQGLSLDELCDKAGFRSTNAVRHYLRVLESRGYLKRRHGCHRQIKLIELAA